jgi:hypothetical protein
MILSRAYISFVVRFEFLLVLLPLIHTPLNLASCRLVNIYWRFVGTYCPHRLDRVVHKDHSWPRTRRHYETSIRRYNFISPLVFFFYQSSTFVCFVTIISGLKMNIWKLWLWQHRILSTEISWDKLEDFVIFRFEKKPTRYKASSRDNFSTGDLKLDSEIWPFTYVELTDSDILG